MTRSIRSLWRALSNPTQDAYEKLQEAKRVAARRMGEMVYHSQMLEFFDDQAQKIDPHTEWWAFAEAKQKWLDHTNDWEVERQRHHAAAAAVHARTEAYYKLKKEQP